MHADCIRAAGSAEAAARPENPILARLIGRANTSDLSLRIRLEDDQRASQGVTTEADRPRHLGEPPVAASGRQAEHDQQTDCRAAVAANGGGGTAGRRLRPVREPPVIDR